MKLQIRVKLGINFYEGKCIRYDYGIKYDIRKYHSDASFSASILLTVEYM